MDMWTDVISQLSFSFIQGVNNDEICMSDVNAAYGIYRG